MLSLRVRCDEKSRGGNAGSCRAADERGGEDQEILSGSLFIICRKLDITLICSRNMQRAVFVLLILAFLIGSAILANIFFLLLFFNRSMTGPCSNGIYLNKIHQIHPTAALSVHPQFSPRHRLFWKGSHQGFRWRRPLVRFENYILYFTHKTVSNISKVIRD